MQIEDAPRVIELWREMDGKLGQQDKPNLFAMPVVITLVCEDEQGVIQSAIYGEAVVDFTAIGTDRGAMTGVHEIFPELARHLSERSIRIVRVLVPKYLARGMARVLPTLTEITQSVAQFVLKIAV